MAALEQRQDGEPHFPETLFDRAWIVALDAAAWRELQEQWPALGEDYPLAPLSEFRLGEPTAAEYGELARVLELAEEEVAMAVSRLHRRFRESLREQVRDTVTSAEELEEEWAELFPDLAGVEDETDLASRSGLRLVQTQGEIATNIQVVTLDKLL